MKTKNETLQGHTPGPWYVSPCKPEDGTRWIHGRDMDGFPLALATVEKYGMDHEQSVVDADARLIAAAPTMLKALEELAAIGEGGAVMRHETGKTTWSALDAVKEIARAAIAKARGAS